jgi:hypothetical protein
MSISVYAMLYKIMLVSKMPPVHAFTLKMEENDYPCVHIEHFLTCGINPQTYGREIMEAYGI